jgi:hypothetical protein
MIACLLALNSAALLVVAGRASAYTLKPWLWEYPSNLRYSIGSSVPSWDVAHIDDAAASWSATPTPLVVVRGSNADIGIHGYSQEDGTGGSGGCTYWSSTGYCIHGEGYVNINWGCHTTCGSLSSTPSYDKYIAMHELGHVFGLGHSSGYGPVMSYGSCTSETHCVTKPGTDDINGINARYGYKPPGGGGAGCYATALLKGTLAKTQIAGFDLDGFLSSDQIPHRPEC